MPGGPGQQLRRRSGGGRWTRSRTRQIIDGEGQEGKEEKGWWMRGAGDRAQ